jgi:hypothetical protein
MALFTASAVLDHAAAGIYSVLSFHVTRRTHELGVRMAFASRGNVLGLMEMGAWLCWRSSSAFRSAWRLRGPRSQLFANQPPTRCPTPRSRSSSRLVRASYS